jgi:hypothetical protein
MSSSPRDFHPGRRPLRNSACQFPHSTRPSLLKHPYLTHHHQRTTSRFWEAIPPHGPTKTQTGIAYSLLIRNRRGKRSIQATCLPCASYMLVSRPVSRSPPHASQSSKSAVSRYVHKRKDAQLRWIISQETFWSPQRPCRPNLREPCSRFLICV